jgi:hypothetical protein
LSCKQLARDFYGLRVFDGAEVGLC